MGTRFPVDQHCFSAQGFCSFSRVCLWSPGLWKVPVGCSWMKQVPWWSEPSQCWGCRAPLLPREPRPVFRALDWHLLSHPLVCKSVGYFRDKDVSSHCSFPCSSEFCHHSTSSIQSKGRKSAGTLALILLQGWASWGANNIIFFFLMSFLIPDC